MKSVRRGNGTSRVEVAGISPHGVWLLVGRREMFLPFETFPWFRNASVAGVLNVTRPSPEHLYWPDLDIDLAVESIRTPEKYPLISRERPSATTHTSSSKRNKKLGSTRAGKPTRRTSRAAPPSR